MNAVIHVSMTVSGRAGNIKQAPQSNARNVLLTIREKIRIRALMLFSSTIR